MHKVYPKLPNDEGKLVVNKCDRCGNDVGEESTDLWVFRTTYDEAGEVIRSQLDMAYQVDQDYMVFCMPCFNGAVSSLWTDLTNKTTGETT